MLYFYYAIRELRLFHSGITYHSVCSKKASILDLYPLKQTNRQHEIILRNPIKKNGTGIDYHSLQFQSPT